MAAISGKDAKVMYGAVEILNLTQWSISGFTKAPEEITTAFGDTIKSYVLADAGEPGTITFEGNYDPADTTGQAALATLCKEGTSLGEDLYLYVAAATFWRVGTGGEILVTKADAVTMPRSGIGKVSFEGKVSGAAMEQVGTGS